MRSLTPAEAVVIRSLLADEPVPHRERIRRAELPPRTYEVARQRILLAGWVLERYVPDPVRFGLPMARFTLAHPYAEQFHAVAQRWREGPRTVFLWEGPDLLFRVEFEPEPTGSSRPRAPATEAGCSRSYSLAVDLRKPTLPAYFDFEGAWSRLMDAPGTYRYPRPLIGEEDGGPALSGPDRTVATALVNRPFLSVGDRESGVATSGVFTRRRQRRLLGEGVVEHRMFLDVTQVPGYQQRRASNVVLVHGELLDGRRPETLFRALVSDCQVTPFLYATDGEEILLAALAPAPGAPRTEVRGGVLATVRAYLRAIEVARTPVETLATPVNHRYDRLVGNGTGAE